MAWRKPRRVTMCTNHRSVRWGKLLKGWGENEEGKGAQIYGDRGNQTLGGEHTMQYTDGVLQNCTLATYIILLIDVTPINLILKNKTSSQDGGIGKHGSPPHTTMANITTRLQNNYHPESTENQKIKLYGSPTTKELKKSHSSRQQEAWNERSHTHTWWIKIRRDTSGTRGPSPIPDPRTQGSSARKINPHNFSL